MLRLPPSQQRFRKDSREAMPKEIHPGDQTKQQIRSLLVTYARPNPGFHLRLDACNSLHISELTNNSQPLP